MSSDFLNYRHMRVFLEVVQTGSVSQAASRCHLSQPAATQALNRLDAELGAPLLIRRRNQFSLTDCGRVFEPRARAALRHLQEGARNAMRPKREPFSRTRLFDTKVTAAQIRALIEISNCGSFTVAARNLNLSQPTVHRAARSLEALAGLAFFSASSSGVTLTRAARDFVLGAKLCQSEIRQAIAEISRALGQERASFILGSLPLARTSIVPKAIHAMIGEIPGAQLRVVDGRYPELLRSLREGDIDCLIGALRHPPPADDIDQELLFRDALAIVAHPNHPLAGRSGLTLQDTLAYPWIAPPKDTPAGQYLLETLQIPNREQTPVRVVSSSMMMLRSILALGNYVSIVSRHQIRVDEEHGHIAPLNIALKGHIRDIGLTTRKDWRPTETQARFLHHLRSFIATPGPP